MSTHNRGLIVCHHIANAMAITQPVARGADGADKLGMRLDSTTPLETAYRVKDAML